MAQFGRYSSENLFKDATSTLMGLKQLAQQKEIAGKRTEIMKTQAETSAGHLKLAQEKQTAELQRRPVPERQFTTGEIAELKAMGGAVDKKLKGVKLSDSITPIANAIEEYTGQGYKKIDISRALKKNWDEYKQPALESLQKAMETAIQSGDKKALSELTQMHTDISSNEFVDKMMPACARNEKDLQEKKKPKEVKQERLYPTAEGWQPRVDAIGKLQPKGKGSGGKLTDFEKAYYQHNARTKDKLSRAEFRKKHWLSDPAIGQEMISLRQDKAYLKRETSALKRKVAKANKFPDIEMYQREAEDAKEQLELHALELKDIQAAMDGLLGKTPKTAHKYKTADAVKSAFRSGELSQKEAIKILTEQF